MMLFMTISARDQSLKGKEHPKLRMLYKCSLYFMVCRRTKCQISLANTTGRAGKKSVTWFDKGINASPALTGEDGRGE